MATENKPTGISRPTTLNEAPRSIGAGAGAATAAAGTHVSGPVGRLQSDAALRLVLAQAIPHTVLWTALPNGRAAGGAARLRLSVFVSPRLGAAGGGPYTLSQFNEWLDWPKTVAGASFSVAFEGGPTVKANVVSPPAESALWTAMFKRDLRVDPHPFQTPAIPAVVSHPVGHVLEFLKSQYVSIGQLSPTAHPGVHLLLGTAAGAAGLAERPGDTIAGDTIAGQTSEGDIHLASYVTAQEPAVRIAAGPAPNFLSRPAGSLTFQHLLVNPSQVQALQEQLTQSLQQNRYIPHRAAVNPPLDFLQLQMFHARTGLTSALYHQPVAPPTVDFHQAVSSLGDYPDLMRRLGLVIDLEVPIEAMPPGAATVRVIPQWGAPPAFSDYSPPTAYVVDAQRFAAAPKPPSAGAEGSGIQVVDGLLDLSDPDQYRVVEVDVDGAALKTAHLAQQLERRVTTLVKQAALPLKSKALVERAVLSRGELAGSNDSAPAAAPPDPGTETLPALRSAGLSLVKAERARHLVNRLQFAASQNERLQALLKQQPPPGGEQPFYAEDLVRGYRIDVWDSVSKAWHSLCKRKGSYTFPAGVAPWAHSDEGFISIGATRKPDDPNLYLHESLFRWTGWSLCAPRPGEAIDPDSHHRSIENTPATPLGLSVGFVAEPGTLPTLRFGASYRFRARAADLAGNGLLLTEATADQDKRATAAAVYSRFDPVTSPTLVLTQNTGASPAESLERLVIRSNYDTPAAAYQTPASPTSARHVAPSPTSQLLAEEKGMFDSHGRPDPGAYALIQGKEGNYRSVEPGASLGMPYLPDPMASGVAFVGLPGTAPGAVHQVSFWPTGSKWPEAKPFRLQIVESAAAAAPAPQWDEGARVLTVSVPKGETAEVQMSSYLVQSDLELMGIWKWLNEGGPAGVAMLQDSLAGRQWMQTPFRTITLVHALQQPLKAPQIQSITPSRTIGGNAAQLAMKVDVSFASTSKLDIMADWTEPVDDPAAPAPATAALSTHVAEVSMADPVLGGGDAENAGDVRSYGKSHEFGNTRYRKVNYSALATTRYMEYFPASLTADPAKVTRASEHPLTVEIPNSARPAAPKILYVVPTFKWERTGGVSKRTGGGLRVYLDRPWYSSGDGELLGVVLLSTARPVIIPGRQGLVGRLPNDLETKTSVTRARPIIQAAAPQAHTPAHRNVFEHISIGALASPTVIPPEMQSYVTQWGNDPAWRTTNVTNTMPAAGDFASAVRIQDSLSIDERPGAVVAVAGHPVTFDPDRKLWYSDIELDPGSSYFPFVRLALARYQPVSIDNAHLSRVVLADFVQLSPDRSATVAADSGAAGRYTISVTGPCHTGSAGLTGGNQVELSVESRDAGLSDEYPWLPVPGSASIAAATGTDPTHSTWAGPITVPAGGGRHRVVIREYELYVAETGSLERGSLERGPLERGGVRDILHLSANEDSPSPGVTLAAFSPDGDLKRLSALTGPVRPAPSGVERAVNPELRTIQPAAAPGPPTDRRLVYIDAIELG